MNNKLCDLLGINYPIVQAPMAYVSGPKLAAAVSNAGGLGVVGPFGGVPTTPSRGDLNVVGERIRIQITSTRQLTKKPFSINVIIGRGKYGGHTDKSLDVCLEEKLPIIYLTYNDYDSCDPQPYIQKAKRGGAKVIVRNVNPDAETARKMEAMGADVLVVAGYDAGGHSGYARNTVMTLVPFIVDAVKIPVVAGGAVGDARGVAAVLALGADGVLIGSRFMTTKESDTPESVQKAISRLKETGTTTFSGPDGEGRAYINNLTKKALAMRERGATFEEIDDAVYKGQTRAALEGGDVENGALFVSPGAGLARNKIVSVDEFMNSLVKGYREVLSKIGPNLGNEKK